MVSVLQWAMWEAVNTYRGRVPVQSNEVGQARLCNDVRLKPHKHYVVLWDVRYLQSQEDSCQETSPGLRQTLYIGLTGWIRQLLLACAKLSSPVMTVMKTSTHRQ